MVMITANEAQQRLPELLAAAEAGETVVIQTESGHTVRLDVQPTSLQNPAWPGYPDPGSSRGLIDIPETFDDPLPELSEYEG